MRGISTAFVLAERRTLKTVLVTPYWPAACRSICDIRMARSRRTRKKHSQCWTEQQFQQGGAFVQRSVSLFYLFFYFLGQPVSLSRMASSPGFNFQKTSARAAMNGDKFCSCPPPADHPLFSLLPSAPKAHLRSLQPIWHSFNAYLYIRCGTESTRLDPL